MKIVNIKKFQNRKYIKQVAKLEIELWNNKMTEIPAYVKGIKESIRRKNCTILCAVDESDDVIGYINLNIYYSHDEQPSFEPILHVFGLYVTPTHRNKGVATQLFKEAEKYGLEFGCTRMSSSYFDFNKSSASLHKSLGFVETNKICRVIKNIENNS